MKIKTKLNLILFLVVLFSALVIGYTVKEYMAEQRAIQKSEKLVLLSQKLSALLHELQKERGAGAGFLGSNGKKFKKIMLQQRRVTDRRIEELQSYLKNFPQRDFPKIKPLIEQIVHTLHRLPKVRMRIDRFSIPVDREIKFYSDLNAKILRLISLTAKLNTNAQLAKALDGYGNFLKAKESAGIERAVLSGVFSANRFKSTLFQRFISLLAEQKAYLDAFKSIAPDKEVAYYQKLMRSPVIKEVQRLRQIAIDRHTVGEFDIDPEYWYKVVTKKIDLLKKVDTFISSYNYELIKKLEHQNFVVGLTKIGIASLFALSIVLIIFLVIRNVSKSVQESLKKIRCVSKDLDLTCNVEIPGKDEIAQISRALHHMIVTFRKSMDKVQRVVESIQGESQKLHTIAIQLLENGQISDKKTKQINSLIEEIAIKLDDLEESSITVQEDLQKTSRFLDEFAFELEKVVDDITQSNTNQQELVQKVQNLTKQAENIQEIIEIISDIANKTNLLALNASIEAARAGEHGRGFSVVADEIRELAEKTQQSLSDIDGSLRHIMDNVNIIAYSVQETSKQMSTISDATRSLISSSNKTKNNLSITIEKSIDSMKKTTYIATKTKQLMETMEEFVKIAKHNTYIREDLEKTANVLEKDANNLVLEIKQFKM